MTDEIVYSLSDYRKMVKKSRAKAIHGRKRSVFSDPTKLSGLMHVPVNGRFKLQKTHVSIP